jgi:hypothetical protein
MISPSKNGRWLGEGWPRGHRLSFNHYSDIVMCQYLHWSTRATTVQFPSLAITDNLVLQYSTENSGAILRRSIVL